MAITYRRTNTDSGLTGGTDFNKAILLPASDTTGSTVISVGNGETGRTSRAFTDVGVPGALGATGDYTVELNITTGSTQIGCTVQLHRVNSSGTVQSSSAVSASQTMAAGTRTYTFTNQALGTWATGDRLRVDYIFSNLGHGGVSCTISHGGTNNEIVTPFTAPTTHSGTGAGAIAVTGGDATGAATSVVQGTGEGAVAVTGGDASTQVTRVATAAGSIAITTSATGGVGFLPPTGLTVTPVSASQLDVSWNSVGTATGYDLERDRWSGSAWVDTTLLSDVTSPYNDTGLSADTTYRYRVRAKK